MGGPSKDPTVKEPEKQAPVVLEASIENPEDLADDPPPQVDTTVVDAMNIHAILPSPKPPNPAKLVEEIPLWQEC